jgi:hypothetical protein
MAWTELVSTSTQGFPSTITQTISSSGTLVIVAAGINTTSSGPTISDTAGNTWFPLNFNAVSSMTAELVWWWTISKSAQVNNVYTINTTASIGADTIGVTMYAPPSGNLTSSALRVENDTFYSAGSTATDALASGALAGTAVGDLIVSVLMAPNGALGTPSYAAGTNFTERFVTEDGSANIFALDWEDQLSGPGGSIQGTWSNINSTGDLAAIVGAAAFIAPSTGAATASVRTTPSFMLLGVGV